MTANAFRRISGADICFNRKNCSKRAYWDLLIGCGLHLAIVKEGDFVLIVATKHGEIRLC